jgi:flagellar L-ring protein precursor FlgH
MRIILALALGAVSACSPLGDVGRVPRMSPPEMTAEHTAMMVPGLPDRLAAAGPVSGSLWSGDRGSLLGDRRAVQRGDILTVVIEIDDRAEFSNSSDMSQAAEQEMSVEALFGIPQMIQSALPEGASLDPAVQTGSSSTASGDGSIRRNEKLTLRVAATIIDVLPNGVLSIQGTQQVRVNAELRELNVTGFVRPEDITRQNEITYDKIAAARISYGGQGQISTVQSQPYGQGLADILLPF